MHTEQKDHDSHSCSIAQAQRVYTSSGQPQGAAALRFWPPKEDYFWVKDEESAQRERRCGSSCHAKTHKRCAST